MRMRNYYRALFAILPLLFTLSLQIHSQDTLPPKLGLTLSGGGAKGLAHIGVLQVLEENGIFPDYVTGTSMGSIVGGLYATGYTPAELERETTTANWNDYFTDSYSRNYLPIDQRSKADRYQLSFALENGKLIIPRGLIGGNKILTLLTGLTACVHNQESFDEFYLPFRCVATDLETGEAYVFDEGPLRKAIRASMSIPSAFDPLEYDGRLLVDGLLARNLPVEDAKAMGADIVIAVDVGDPLYQRDELTSVLRVLEQTSSYVMVESTEKQYALADWIIDPDLDGYSTLSYDAAQALIKRGADAARANLPALQAFLDSVGWEARPIPKRPNCRRDSFYLKDIIYVGEDTRLNRTLERLISWKLPRVTTIADLEQLIGVLYSSGFFSLVDYELRFAPEGGYILALDAEPTPEVYVRGSLNYDIDFNAALLVNVSVRNPLGSGSLLTGDIRISEFPGFWLDYALRSPTTPSFGMNLYANGQIIPGQIFTEEELSDEFTFHHYTTGIDLETSISRQWYFQLGVGGEHFSENPRFFSLSELDARSQRLFASAHLIRDTYDRTYFPEDGSLSQLWFEYNLSGRLEEAAVGGANFETDGNWTIGGKVHKAFQFGEHFWVDASAGAGHTNITQPHFLQQFYLGREIPANNRFFEVYGLRISELPVTSFGYGRIQLRQEIGQENYLGLGYNYGAYAQIINEERLSEGTFQAVGAELGSVTTLGPIRFTAEYNLDFERFNFSFFVGYRF